MMSELAERIREDHLNSAGRHDSPAIFGGEAGDPGLVGGPGSMSWEIHSDVAAISIGGLGAIVLEILHPSVIAGVQDHSTYQADPLRRSRSTYGYVVTTTFANTTAATRLINAVHNVHSRINGVRPDGVPYQALQPELIGWVHTCIPWAVMTAFELYNRPLTPAERDRYLTEQAVIGRMAGAEQVPETAAELAAYVEDMRPRLAVTAQTMNFLDFLLADPPGTPPSGRITQRLRRLQAEMGMGLMPQWAARMAGFASTSVERKLVHRPLFELYARTLRWAYDGPPAYVRLANERALAVPAPASAAVAG